MGVGIGKNMWRVGRMDGREGEQRMESGHDNIKCQQRKQKLNEKGGGGRRKFLFR